MQQDKLNDAINSYYKLKEKYEQKYNASKQRIITDTRLSTKEKQHKFKQLKQQCIHCKKDGGSIFTDKHGKLKVVCGNIQDPCKLNIEIDKGKYRNSQDLADELGRELDIVKIHMIKIKLDFLFGYISEEDALVKFNSIKESVQKKSDAYQKVELFFLNITDNKDKEKLIEEANESLYTDVQKIKDLCKVFEINESKLLLKNAVEIYVRDVMPVVESIIDLKYVYKAIDYDDDTKTLVEKEYTISDLEYPLKEGKIIFNKK